MLKELLMRCHPVLRIEYVSADGKTAEREIPVEEGKASDGRTEFSLTERGGIFAPRLVSAFPETTASNSRCFSWQTDGRLNCGCWMRQLK